MRSGPCASRKSRASFRAVGRFEAATESSKSRISASAPDSRPRASLRSLSAGTNSSERMAGSWVRLLFMSYYVYLLASRKHGTLYAGVTNDLVRRVYEHKSKAMDGFTAKYGADQLVWFETHDGVGATISREKEIKKWRREWKIALIEPDNPDWLDLWDAIIK